MKKHIYIAIILILSIYMINNKTSQIMGTGWHNNAIIQSFELSKSEFLEYNINSTLYLKDVFLSAQEMKNTLNEIMQKIDIDLNSELLGEHKSKDEIANQHIVTYDMECGKKITINLYSSKFEQEKETYIIIDILQNKEYKGIVEEYEFIEALLGEYGNEIQSTLCIVGTYEENKTEKNRIKTINRILNLLNAEKIEQIIDNNYISTTAYMKEITKFLEYGNNKVNLNIAMRYNEYEGRTYIYIATPLIVNTY